jgi:type II secretory pathway component PulK
LNKLSEQWAAVSLKQRSQKNIKTDLGKRSSEDMKWTELAQNQVKG